MQVIHAPGKIPVIPVGAEVVFLAGSIEMGAASDWQSEFVKGFEQTDTVFLNPRRPAWDPTWEQSISNPHFNQQVNWELDGLELCTTAVFYFEPSTRSPISLLELGLTAKAGKSFVCCPPGFWRRGNVEIVCQRANALFNDNLSVIKDIVLARVAARAGGF